MAVAPRLRLAAEVVDAQPADRILEVGCGHGVLVDLIASRLTTGHVVGVDRSVTMITAAELRNAAHVAAGHASFAVSTIAGLDLGDQGFDKVLGVNVRALWAAESLAVVRRALAPGGALLVIFQEPAADPPTESIRQALRAGGFWEEAVTREPTEPYPTICVRAGLAMTRRS